MLLVTFLIFSLTLMRQQLHFDEKLSMLLSLWWNCGTRRCHFVLYSRSCYFYGICIYGCFTITSVTGCPSQLLTPVLCLFCLLLHVVALFGFYFIDWCLFEKFYIIYKFFTMKMVLVDWITELSIHPLHTGVSNSIPLWKAYQLEPLAPAAK